MKTLLSAAALLLAAAAWADNSSPAPSASPPPAPVIDPSGWLGFTPESAYRDRGAPAEIYPLAVDDKRWQVVHFYADHTYLFWSSNRVWQVRLDKQWLGTWKGLTMGMTRDDAETALGVPLAKGDNWSVWPLPYQNFPKRLRLVFTDGKLSDAYVYRSEL
jgi:hypothetical protein